MHRVSSAIMFGLGLAIVAVVSVGAQAPGGSADGKKMKNPVAVSAESIAAGKTAYEKNCRFCHGTDAKGNGAMAPKDTHPSDLTDATWDRGATDGEIFLVLRDGAGPDFKMKGYKGRMTEPDMWNVINYLRSLAPKK
jgi:mono/diheme cytochrome c family protein